MRYYDSEKNQASQKYLGRKLSLVIALLTAITMWFVVCSCNRMETQISVRLDYHGLPEGMVVTSGLVPNISIRLRGPATLLRSIPTNQRWEIKLSGMKLGMNRIPLPQFERAYRERAFELVDIDPPGLDIEVDTLDTKNVKIELVADDTGDSNLHMSTISTNPPTVMLKGPKSKLDTIDSPLKVSVRLDAKDIHQQIITNELSIDTPKLITSTPTSISASYKVSRNVVTVPRRCRIRIEANNAADYIIEPEYLNMYIKVPKNQENDTSWLDRITCSVAPGKLGPGQSRTVNARVHEPKGMQYSIQQDKVRITRRAAAPKTKKAK